MVQIVGAASLQDCEQEANAVDLFAMTKFCFPDVHSTTTGDFIQGGTRRYCDNDTLKEE